MNYYKITFSKNKEYRPCDTIVGYSEDYYIETKSTPIQTLIKRLWVDISGYGCYESDCAEIGLNLDSLYEDNKFFEDFNGYYTAPISYEVIDKQEFISQESTISHHEYNFYYDEKIGDYIEEE